MTLTPLRERGRRPSLTLAAALLALVAVVAIPFADPAPSTVDAATARPLAVVVVGPVGGTTGFYMREARRITAQLRAHGARVRLVTTPWATWARVTKAARGANLFVYLGHGNGYPSPYGRFDPLKMNGLGLNRSGGHGHHNVRYYGEYYVRRLHLAPGAVVILNHVCYAAGGSEPGRAAPARSTAVKRADNFAAGFLRAGAAAVFASDRSVAPVIRDLFRSGRSMRSVFWHSPWTSSRYDLASTSRRTLGATAVLAPYRRGRYYQSVVGHLAWTTTDWRQSWNPPVIAVADPTSSPDPVAAPSGSPDPAASPAPTPAPVADPTAAPTPEPAADPAATPSPTTTPSPSPSPTPAP